MSYLAPFTGYGNDPATSVKFSILQNGNSVPQWESAALVTEHQMANSNRTVTQMHGRGPWRISLTLEFVSLDDYERMNAMLGTRATLRYISGITNRAGGMLQTILAVQYLVLADTLLVSMGNPVYEVGNFYTCTASFQRHYGGA